MASILFDGFFFFSVCLCRKYKYKNDSVHHFFTSRHKNPIPRDSGRQSGDREAAGRQAKPGRETAEEAGRSRRSPVVDRAGERRRAESDRTGLTEQTTHNGARKTGAQP